MKARVMFFWALLGVACAHTTLDRRLVSGDHETGVASEDVPVKGATVHVDVPSESTTYPAELIAVDTTYIYVNTGSDWRRDTRAIPRTTIRRVVVDLYRSDAGWLTAWTALGCASTASHGYYLVLTAPVWLAAGVTSAVSADDASSAKAGPNELDQLYQYARFPQGMPRARHTADAVPTPPTSGTQAPPAAGTGTSMPTPAPAPLPPLLPDG